jgi:type IX secretion system PorP/SprF family membrane protein
MIFFGLLFLATTGRIEAQDIHFSQFYMSPLNLNPAMTGVMNCTQRVVVNYRNQWAGVLGANAYNTYSASYDRRLPVGKEDYFGVGGSLWGDVAGSSRFGTTQARVSFAFSKKMAGNRKKSHYLSVGADAGVSQRRVRTGDLRWPTQVTNGQYDPSVGFAESIPNDNFLFADLSGGLLWFSNLGDRTNFYFGAAMHHLNQPNVSFLNNEESLYSRLTFHIGGEYPINKKISLRPNLIYMEQGPHKEINAGTSVRFKMGGNPSTVVGDNGQFLQVGAWYRVGSKVDGGIHGDALIFSTRFDFNNYGIGFSYDYNVSNLNAAATANGSFELSLTYLICGGTLRGVYCPTF